jgi:hypothetical protein
MYFEIHHEAPDALTRDVWDVSIGLAGTGGDCKVDCCIVRFRREARKSSRSKWVNVAFWASCMGPTCRPPFVPPGYLPPVPLEAMPKLSDAEVLQAVQARMGVSWPEGA